MAHFAELDKDNNVLRVIVISNDNTHDKDDVEQEALGIAFCQSLFGENTKWVQTSFNANKRIKYAAIGDTYDVKLDAFIAPSPYPSWTLNKTTWHWEPPIPSPVNGIMQKWNEEKLQWEESKVIEETPLAIE